MCTVQNLCAENLQIVHQKKLCFAHFSFLRIFAFVRGEFVHGENFCGESAEKVFCAGFFLSPWFFCALRETFLGGGGPGGGGGVRGGGPGGPGGQNGQKRAKKGVFGGVRGGGPKWAVSVPEWYTSGSASTASHSTGWQKSPEYALIRIAAGPPFPGHFPPPGPPGKSHRFLGPLFGPPPQKRVPPPLFSPRKVSLSAQKNHGDRKNPAQKTFSADISAEILPVHKFSAHNSAPQKLKCAKHNVFSTLCTQICAHKFCTVHKTFSLTCTKIFCAHKKYNYKKFKYIKNS